MSRLRLYANLWTLTGHPSPAREWSLARKIAAIADAGFDGVTGALDELAVELARARKLEPVGWFWATDRAAIDAGLAKHVRLGVRRVTVFIGRHDTPARETLALALYLHRGARAAGLHVAPETHRDTATETPEKTAALLAGFRRRTGEEMPVTWDFSHHALVKHLAAADWPARLLTEPENIAQAELFHFRPFNGQHAQIPVPVAKSAKGVLAYRDALVFFELVMRRWRAAPGNAKRELWACPEVGPVAAGYALDGEPAPWAQAIKLAEDLRAAWRHIARPDEEAWNLQ